MSASASKDSDGSAVTRFADSSNTASLSSNLRLLESTAVDSRTAFTNAERHAGCAAEPAVAPPVAAAVPAPAPALAPTPTPTPAPTVLTPLSEATGGTALLSCVVMRCDRGPWPTLNTSGWPPSSSTGGGFASATGPLGGVAVDEHTASPDASSALRHRLMPFAGSTGRCVASAASLTSRGDDGDDGADGDEHSSAEPAVTIRGADSAPALIAASAATTRCLSVLVSEYSAWSQACNNNRRQHGTEV